MDLEQKIKSVLIHRFGSDIPDDVSIFKVRKLDTNQYYYLVGFEKKHDHKTILLIINESDSAILQSAEVDQVVTINKPLLVQQYEKDNATTELVWKACRISFSPFYPFWKIALDEHVWYVGNDNRLYENLPEGFGG